MNLDRRAVKAYHLHIDLDDSLRLKRCKHSAEHSVLAPSVHANIDRMLISIDFRQRPPLAAVFRDIQDRIYQLKIAHADVSALSREVFRYLFVLFLCNLHGSIMPDTRYFFIVNSVNML